MKMIKFHPKTDSYVAVWFDGVNQVEAAQWLVGHGKRPVVEFHQYGATLRLDGKEIRTGEHHGVWIDTTGMVWPDETLRDGNVVTEEQE